MTGPEEQRPDEALVSSVVRIKGLDGQPIGAGFLVAPDQVLTCAHVVTFALSRSDTDQEAVGASVTLDMPLDPRLAGPTWTAQVEHFVAEQHDGTGDVALLRLQTVIPGSRALPMVEPKTAWDDEVGIVGFTSTSTGGIWVKAKLSGPTGEGRRQFSRADGETAYVEEGFSGSPIWDPRHRAVVGIVSVAQPGRQAQQAFAIRKDSVVRDIPELDSALSPASPFLGLETFQESHSHVYFGRKDDAERVARALADHSSVTVYGPSGSGKSSMALAGVVPSMRADGYDVLVVNAGVVGSPLVALANDMYEVLVVRRQRHEPKRARSAGEVQAWLTDLGLLDTLHRLCGKAGRKLLLVLDQAEALLAREDAEVAELVRLLLPESRSATGLRVLLTLRADFMDEVLKHPHLGPALRDGVTLPLTPMSREQLREVISKPLEQVPGVTYERGLVDRILDDAGSGPGTLPLLGFVLQRLWADQEHGQLRLAAYEAAGGVSGALAKHAEEAWLRCLGKQNKTSEGERPGKVGEAARRKEAEARQLLTGLVRVLPGSPAPLRRRLTRQEAGETRWQIANWFAGPKWRLLVMHGGQGEQETVELAHEALVTVWPALQDQVRADSEFLAGRAELGHERERWTKGGQAPGLLPGALQLDAIEKRLGNREDELGKEERDFLRVARERRQVQRNRGRAAWIAVSVVFALIAGLGTFLVYQSRVSSQREAESRSRQLATFSAEVAKRDSGQAALIAMAAYEIAPTDEARNAMLRQYDQLKDAAWVLSGAQGKIRSAASSVDGMVTLVVTDNGRATLFVRQSGGRVQRLQLSLDEMAFLPLVSRDGQRIAYLSATGAVVWHDVDHTANKPDSLLGAAHTLRSKEFKAMASLAEVLGDDDDLMAFSPNGKQLATVSSDRLRLWDLSTERHRDVPGQVPANVEAVEFGQNQNTLVVRSRSRTSKASVSTVEVGTGKVRKLADDVNTGGLYGSPVGLSGDGTVMVVCREAAEGEGKVYQALRVTDGRVLGSYTDERETSGCESIAVDEAGERFAANEFDTWTVVDIRQGRRVQQIKTRTPEMTVGRLFHDGRQPLVLTVAEDKNTLTALPLTPSDVDGRDIVVNTPRLIDGGKTMVARVKPQDKPAVDETLALVDASSGQVKAEAKRPDTPPSLTLTAAHALAVNDGETLVADVVDSNKIIVRQIPSLHKVAEITTLSPPVSERGNAEPLTLGFLPGGDELLTLSGSRIEHWNARTGHRLSKTIDARKLNLSKKNPPAFGSTERATDSGFAVNGSPEEGHIQIMIYGDPVLHTVNLRTGKENQTQRIRLGQDVERAFLDSSGQHAAAKTPGGMLELWSAETGQEPTRLVGPLGPLGANRTFTGDGFTFNFTGRDGEFYLANGSSVRFQQLSDSSHATTYDFVTNQYFLAATKDGKTLVRVLSEGGFGGNDGRGRLDLIRLDPELWQRHLCDAIGRDLTPDDRRGLPAGLPDRICPA
ncbi:trypsin-like peptidase domain-containing protein [Streptomyces sp. LHD-70]|uniref:nSTAND1 domain-containing NTPase n=1 Tax=Streptomyces sp. LHD-70 TaxID=3072140 RepID=UPI00280D5CC7|nr:trypsin-like peptidase domain-containing protein [Streptomyces sp. LHD-70]MDQ8706159.1 trypsin-like peptidase domain-containing protein [Streptomyces sp. LHD-70]